MAETKWMVCPLCSTCKFHSSDGRVFKCSAGTTSAAGQAYRFPEGTKKDTCPEFKAAASDISSSSSRGSSGGGAIGAGIGGVVGGLIAGAIADANSAEKAQIEADEMREHNARIAEDLNKWGNEKNTNIQKVMSCKFDGDAGSIVQELSTILATVTAYKPKNIFAVSYAGEQEARKAIYNVGIERMEFGIQQLRSKGDMANADYFQTKLEGMKDNAAKKLFRIIGSLRKKIKSVSEGL